MMKRGKKLKSDSSCHKQTHSQQKTCRAPAASLTFPFFVQLLLPFEGPVPSICQCTWVDSTDQHRPASSMSHQPRLGFGWCLSYLGVGFVCVVFCFCVCVCVAFLETRQYLFKACQICYGLTVLRLLKFSSTSDFFGGLLFSLPLSVVWVDMVFKPHSVLDSINPPGLPWLWWTTVCRNSNGWRHRWWQQIRDHLTWMHSRPQSWPPH